MDKTQLFRLIEKHSAKIEESSKNGIIAHHVEVDDLVDDLFALCEVSRSKPIKEETKNHIKDIAKYTEIINKMRLKDLDIHLDYGQTTDDKTLS